MSVDLLPLPDVWAVHEGEALATLARLPDACCDGLFTDQPYSSGGMVRGDRAARTGAKYVQSNSANREALEDFSGDTRDQRAYGYWCALWLSECLRIVKPGGVAVLFCDWRQLPATTDALQAGGWVWRGIVPWVKPGARMQPGRFSAACEFVVWGTNGPREIEGTPLPGFYSYTAPREREHQAQKPVALMVDLLAIAPASGLILDPFCGSGTTGVAAVQTGRRFIGCEMVPAHAATARARIGRAAGERIDRGSQMALV